MGNTPARGLLDAICQGVHKNVMLIPTDQVGIRIVKVLCVNEQVNVHVIV